MNKLILTDVDGVLLDWETAFHAWMVSNGFVRNNIATYDMHVVYNKEKDHIKALIREFNESAWICCLEPFRDAVDGVKALAAKGYRFGAITSLSNDIFAAKLRERNLATVFGDVFDFVTCIDTGADKDESLLPYKDSGLYWIEDKPENAAVGADFGLKTLLLRHPHNANFHYDGVKGVDNWAQIVNTIS
jgi:phosphoglycolate phosphatase-like HAD superfamily hydrolase